MTRGFGLLRSCIRLDDPKTFPDERDGTLSEISAASRGWQALLPCRERRFPASLPVSWELTPESGSLRTVRTATTPQSIVLYDLLDHPWLYRTVTAVTAPGFRAQMTGLAGDLVGRLSLEAPFLDVGCGPASVLADLGIRPVGLDLSRRYAARLTAAGSPAVVGTADRLPFAGGAFNTVWTIGLLHHLSDAAARTTVEEMMRVCAPNGRVVVIDAVLPRSPWRNPYVYGIRKLDRGGHVREQSEHECLLPPNGAWSVERVRCSSVGHEVVVCTC